jgi:hypothetical protein
MKRTLALVASAALLTAGCFKSSATVTTPSNTSAMIGGTWVTVAHVPVAAGVESCTNFNWAVTSFTGTTGSGTFSATCFGNVQIAGSASGTINASNISWSANATATVQGQPPCAISLSGTATLQTDQIVIPWTGSTCLGPVSGTETVKR